MHFILDFSFLFLGWVLSKLTTPWTFIEQSVVQEVDRFFSEYSLFSIIIIPTVLDIIHLSVIRWEEAGC